MELNCSELEHMLIDMLEGKLGDGQVARAQRHLAACDACRAKSKQAQAAYTFLHREMPQAANAIPVPHYLAMKIKHKMEHRTDARHSWWRGSALRPAMAAAAGITIAVAASLIANMHPADEFAAISPDLATVTQAQQHDLYQITTQTENQAGMQSTRPHTETIGAMQPRTRQDFNIQSTPQVQSPILMVRPVRYDREM